MSWVAIGGSVAGAVVSGAMSGGGSSGQQNITSSGGGNTQSQSSYSPHSSALPGYGFLAGNQQNMMQRPVPYFPGQGYVSPSKSSQMGVGSMMDAASGMQNPLQTMAGNYNFLSGAADIQNNPYVQGMLDTNEKRVNQNFSENLLPQINQGANEVNAMGSSRHGLAQAQGAERTAEQLSRMNSETMLGAYGQGLSAQQSALGQTGNVLQNMLMPARAQMQAGQSVEGYQGNALQDAMNRFNYQYTEPQTRMNQTANTLNTLKPLGTQYGSGQNTSQQTQPNQNYRSPMQNVIGGASMGGGFGNWLSGQNWGGSGGGSGGNYTTGGQRYTPNQYRTWM